MSPSTIVDDSVQGCAIFYQYSFKFKEETVKICYDFLECGVERVCDIFLYSRGHAGRHGPHRVSEMIVLHDRAFSKGFHT